MGARGGGGGGGRGMSTRQCGPGEFRHHHVHHLSLVRAPLQQYTSSRLTLSGTAFLSNCSSFFRKLGSPSICLAVGQSGLRWNKTHTADMTVSTRGGGLLYTLSHNTQTLQDNCIGGQLAGCGPVGFALKQDAHCRHHCLHQGRWFAVHSVTQHTDITG